MTRTTPKGHKPEKNAVVIGNARALYKTSQHEVQYVTDEMRQNDIHIPPKAKFLPVKDQWGNTILKEKQEVVIFKGMHLHYALQRAKRYIRKLQRETPGTGDFKVSARHFPHHIKLALQALKNMDPGAFETDVPIQDSTL